MLYRNGRLWVLGGNDGEMRAIKEILLIPAGEKFVQPGTEWGDLVYGPNEVFPGGTNGKLDGLELVVFVECKPSSTWHIAKTQVVDHHNERSGEPASVLQVQEILKPSFTVAEDKERWIRLVAANDVGVHSAMEAFGATRDEIRAVRRYSMEAQGIGPDRMAQARLAVNLAEKRGNVLIIRPPHAKCMAPITDCLWEDGRRGNFLIIAGSVRFQGDGEICSRLCKLFGGWAGGTGLGQKGAGAYWGCRRQNFNLEQVLAEVNRR